MRTSNDKNSTLRSPKFLKEATQLNAYLKSLNTNDIAKIMKIKTDLANKTKVLIGSWSAGTKKQQVAIDAFLGDIYSGLQASSLDEADRAYADRTLIILSGQYGIIRPLDGIMPYRLEMAYRLPGLKSSSLYEFWGDKIVKQIPDNELILNLSSVEYSKVVTKFVENNRVITPRFLTKNKKINQPTFVAVHAKIARGAFARWMIVNRINTIDKLTEFTDLGYRYDETLSSPMMPVFICDEFKGFGLSVRLR